MEVLALRCRTDVYKREYDTVTQSISRQLLCMTKAGKVRRIASIRRTDKLPRKAVHHSVIFPFIYICSTRYNLQLTAQFFYMMYNLPGINILLISWLIFYTRSLHVHTP
jgi:hypothetical protein